MTTNADNLLGTRYPAPMQAAMLAASAESWAYHYGRPYPRYNFGAHIWPADRGPTPTPLPYVNMLVSEGAEFLFRNGVPAFSVADDPEADGLLADIIRQNGLNALWIALAENAANQGALCAKFSVDLNNLSCPVRISFLDVPNECRVWVDPHDIQRILMARIQYPYRDLGDGRWYYFREEWTDDWHYVYLPKLASDASVMAPTDIPGYTEHLGDEDGKGWEIDQEASDVNPFGVIPLTLIRNKTVIGNPLGEGDCWRVFRLIDRIALTMHGEDRANQFHSHPVPAVKNGRVNNEGPLLPGEMLEIVNDNPEAHPADIELLEPHGRARQYTQANIEKWEALLYHAVGLSRVSMEDVSNKGNLTALAFAMIYGRTISTSDRKRQLWGENGMARFFANLLLGLQRLGGVKEVSQVTEETVVSTEWPDYFEATPEDVKTVTDRTHSQIQNGTLPLERGAERIAIAEKVPKNEIPQLVQEVKAAAAARKARALQEDADQPQGVDEGEQVADLMDASGTNNMSA